MLSSSPMFNRAALARPRHICAPSGHSHSLGRPLEPLETVIRETSSNRKRRAAIRSLPSISCGAFVSSAQGSHPSGGFLDRPTRRTSSTWPSGASSSQSACPSSTDSGETKTAAGSSCRRAWASSLRRHCMGAKQPMTPAFLRAIRRIISRLEEGICTRARAPRPIPRAIRFAAMRSVRCSSSRQVNSRSESRQATFPGKSRA